MNDADAVMTERKNLCVVAIKVVTEPALDLSKPGNELFHAIERAVRRIEKSIMGNQGTVFWLLGDEIRAGFDRAELAVSAACEMLERVNSLPPVGGYRFTLCIGVHYGTLALDDEPRGDGLDVALSLRSVAKPGEALASGAAVVLLPGTARSMARPRDPIVTLGDFEWPLFSLSRLNENVVSVAPSPAVSQRLRLRHQNDVIYVDDKRPVILFGREMANDIVIMDPRASRQHCRIERLADGFALVDYSSNGCYVVEEGSSEKRVRRASLPLIGPGRVGCGFSANEVERDLVFFEIV